MVDPEGGLQSGHKDIPGPCTPTGRLTAVTVAMVFLLAIAAVTVWAVVTSVRKVDSELYHVQVTADSRLSVYDPETEVWRLVCSSGSNQPIGQLSCQQMGFV
ncbi:serine protease hepsin-like, partial [Mustelus asterias]